MSTTTTRSVPAREVSRGAGVGQPALLLSREQLRRCADDLGRRDEEVLAVGGVPYGRRRHQAGPAHPLGVHDGAVGPQGGKGALHRLRAESTGRVDALTQAGDRHLPGAHVAAGPTTSRRVEFVPQSSAASAPSSSTPPSITERARVSRRAGLSPSSVRRPRPDDVVAPGQPPGQVGMEALDPLARARRRPRSDAARSSRPGSGRRARRRSGGGPRPAPPRPPASASPDAAGGLEPAHARAQLGSTSQ